MSGGGLLVRVTIIVPIMFVVLFLVNIIYEVADPILAMNQNSDAVASLGWQQSPEVAMLMFTIASAVFGVGLLLWMILGDLADDVMVGRRM